ncbi:MAG: SDR family oxidoreductase [Streptosporangiaceae bacterium]
MADETESLVPTTPVAAGGARRVLVTGGSSGLGLAMAAALAEAGAFVALTSRSGERARETAASLPGAIGLELDVRDETSVTRAVAEAEARLGGIDMLVNNAGIGMRTVNPGFLSEPQGFWNVSPDGFRAVIDTNLTGYFLVAREVTARMLAVGQGRIVNISMNHSTMNRAGFVPYGPSRAGAEALSRIMAADLSGTGVTVNMLLPGGATRTGMVPPGVPDRALLDPAIMGPPIVWLVSAEASGVHDERIIATEFGDWLRRRVLTGLSGIGDNLYDQDMLLPSGDGPDPAVGSDRSAPAGVPGPGAEPAPMAPAGAGPEPPAASADAGAAPPAAPATAEPPSLPVPAGPEPEPASLTEMDPGAPTPPAGNQFAPHPWAPPGVPPAAPGTPDAPGIPAPGTAVPAARARHRPRWTVTLAVALAVAAVIVLVAAFGAAGRAHAELIRKPTPAELSAAAALGAASRWQRWPAGQIFPAELPYTSDLLNDETAQRAGIAPGDGCAAAVDTALAALTRRYGCRAALRASYLDQLGGVVYTIGVLAFPGPRGAAGFFSHYSADRSPVLGLQALALPGTSAAAFTDAARQAASASLYGSYVVLTVAGYADGRSAAATGERRPSAFAPATQLATSIGTPLAQPVTVRCATREWSC